MYQYRTIQPRIRRHAGRVGCLLILLLLVGGLGFVVLRAHTGVTLTVGMHPTVIGDECNGPVLIQAGPVNQVTLADIFPRYIQERSSDTIEITSCDEGITMTVPPRVDLTMSTTGAITVIGVSGTLRLETNGSRITLEHVQLTGASRISDNGGPVVFSGSLARGSTSTISDNGGSIDMALPAASSFHLTLSGILGPLVSNFPGVRASAGTASVQVTVGSPSAIDLALALNDTAVILQGA